MLLSRSESGTTLIELSIAAAIIGVGVMGLVLMSRSLDQARASDVVRLRAQWTAQGIADAISSLDHATLDAYIKVAPATPVTAASVTAPPLDLTWLTGWQSQGVTAVSFKFNLKMPDGSAVPVAAYAASDSYDIQLVVSVAYKRSPASPAQTLLWNKKVDPR